MSEDTVKDPASPAEELQPAPPLKENPRNAAIASIAKGVFARHDEEASQNASVPSVDDDHALETLPPAEDPTPVEVAPASPEEPPLPATESLNPDSDYEVVVEGQKVLVKGSTIIEAGKRTLQKEAAADHKLRLASQLLEEAERRSAATPPGAPAEQPPASKGITEEQLAHALQFGTPEESTNAVRELLARGSSETRILQLSEERARLVAADEFEFRRGQALLHRDFKDLMERPALRRLFESEDARMLQGGDRRPYGERYRAIGEQLRKDFGLSAPTAPIAAPTAGTVAARQVAKAKAPTVPRTAAARLGEGGGELVKPITPSDVIAGMAAARGKNRLTDPLVKRS